MLTLGICLAYIAHAQASGLDAPRYVPGAMLITAAVFLLAALPTFLILRERGTGLIAGEHVIRSAYRQVGDTLRHARTYPDLFRFLLCIVFYQAGVQAVIALAAVYAQQAMGFDTQESILLILVVNVTAAIGAVLFGHVQDRIGHRPTIAITLTGWLVTVVLAWFASEPGLFWLAANIAGLCLGASQSAGRALVGYLSPLPHRAEFFGLWGLAVKLSSILGPITYGVAVWLTAGAHRPAMLTLGVFFLIGLAILAGVDVRRGRRQALQDAKKRIAAVAALG
jgi:UMF1 family MFS transporter